MRSAPHAEARVLWNEAVETFGVRAQDLTFLRARAKSFVRSPERSRTATVEL